MIQFTILAYLASETKGVCQRTTSADRDAAMAAANCIFASSPYHVLFAGASKLSCGPSPSSDFPLSVVLFWVLCKELLYVAMVLTISHLCLHSTLFLEHRNIVSIFSFQSILLDWLHLAKRLRKRDGNTSVWMIHSMFPSHPITDTMPSVCQAFELLSNGIPYHLFNWFSPSLIYTCSVEWLSRQIIGLPIKSIPVDGLMVIS